MESLLDSLNPRQREAVEHTEGPILIVAGAGSGKTRVLVHRLAFILARGLARPPEVVAVTFTNKAAGEMKERVERLVGADRGGARVSTFHSWCLRYLRRYADRLGYTRDFLIYDDSDQLSLIKECLADLEIDERAYPPRLFRHRISSAKNQGLDPESFERAQEGPQGEMAAKVFAQYQRRLAASNAMDFDDLIVQTLRLFAERDDLARAAASDVRYLMVDEYQDTNRPQYRLIRHLAAAHGNVCAVGDPDQSIYRFRFADIRNILSFEEDFPGTRIIKLEQNYRSTGNILEAATAVIRHNRDRIDKSLWSQEPEGRPLEMLVAFNEGHEAERIIARIGALRRDHALEDFAILYRTKAQSRALEEALARHQMPYIVVGGTRFYDRREVKDVLAYLRALLNPRDDVSLKRIVNTPPRDIGKTTLDTVLDVARKDAAPLEQAMRKTIDLGLAGGRAARALEGFLGLMADLRAELQTGPPSRLVAAVIERTLFEAHLEKTAPVDAASRIENLAELVSAVAAFDGAEGGLQSFLDRTALLSETENVQGTSGIRLMTLHSAKGLEFPVVFISGMEENLFPHSRSSDEHEDIEEERRLLYVGMTRARERLLLTRALQRRLFGEATPTEPSRFLQEIPQRLLNEGDLGDDRGMSDATTRILGAAEAIARRRMRGARSGWLSTGAEPDDADGADSDAPSDPSSPFTLGCKVHHPQYGVGTVIRVEGSGDALKLTVSFSIHGSKKFLPRFAPLEKI
ncbi:MAG TPA: UvrD-helicase domain-containing protein [Candidatus Polarisedimenticolia bacterium]|nr:UvrD-helicase domain-containing protein [Candidatus Polarisedimenticolia bacterium]